MEKQLIHKLRKFNVRTNGGTCINQRPIVKKWRNSYKKVTLLADGPSTEDGEMSLGKNCVSWHSSTWEGYNYEDAMLIK